MTMRGLPLFTLPLILLAGCAVGPALQQPKVAGADAGWAGGARPGEVEAEPWRALGDPLLSGLIERAIAANADLREAEARLLEARAGRAAAAGAGLPEVQASLGASYQKLSKNGQIPLGAIPGVKTTFSLFDGGFDASWELDLWGRNRRAVEAADRRVAAADAGRREVRLQLVAEVGRAYADLRGAQAELASLSADAKVQRETAGLVRQLYRAGEAAGFDDARADAAARQAEAALPGVEARIRAASFQLGVLTGQPPEAMAALLTPAPLPAGPAVAAGLRSDVLRRRPDIAAAEAELAAATADVGVATADLFPRLALVGGVGQQARALGDIASTDSTRFSIGPSLHWPIFTGGQVRAQIAAADARQLQAAARYEKAVLGALADSESAIDRQAAAARTAEELGMARDRAATALDLARQRFRAGEDDLLVLLDAQSRFNAADRAAAQARTQALQAWFALVKALGGGWAEKEAG